MRRRIPVLVMMIFAVSTTWAQSPPPADQAEQIRMLIERVQQLEKRVERYPIRPLTAAERDRFQQSWRAVQAKFVDDPIRALAEADQLLGEAMSACGYPVGDFEQRAQEFHRGPLRIRRAG